jgi:hypothetical protein
MASCLISSCTVIYEVLDVSFILMPYLIFIVQPLTSGDQPALLPLLSSLATVEVRMALEDRDVAAVATAAPTALPALAIAEASAAHLCSLPDDAECGPAVAAMLQAAKEAVAAALACIAAIHAVGGPGPSAAATAVLVACVRLVGAWLAEETTLLHEELLAAWPGLLALVGAGPWGVVPDAATTSGGAAAPPASISVGSEPMAADSVFPASTPVVRDTPTPDTPTPVPATVSAPLAPEAPPPAGMPLLPDDALPDALLRLLLPALAAALSDSSLATHVVAPPLLARVADFAVASAGSDAPGCAAALDVLRAAVAAASSAPGVATSLAPVMSLAPPARSAAARAAALQLEAAAFGLLPSSAVAPAALRLLAAGPGRLAPRDVGAWCCGADAAIEVMLQGGLDAAARPGLQAAAARAMVESGDCDEDAAAVLAELAQTLSGMDMS